MFDSVDLPIEISKYLVSLTPLLAIYDEKGEKRYKMVEHYFWLEKGNILVKWPNSHSPKYVSFNILKKGEDKNFISAIMEQVLDDTLLADSAYIPAPRFKNAVANFECEKVADLDLKDIYTITIYKLLSAYGVMGLEPAFNDPVTIAKTIEVMSLSPVDGQIIKRKIYTSKR